MKNIFKPTLISIFTSSLLYAGSIAPANDDTPEFMPSLECDAVTLPLSDDTSVPTIVMSGCNAAPVITQGDEINVTMSEDSSPTPFSLTLNATDIENDTLTWSIDTNSSNGVASISSTNTGVSQAISYTPNQNFNGDDSFVVKVSDVKGSSTITVNIAVEPIDDAPIFNQTISNITGIKEDGTINSITLPTSTDIDGDTVNYSVKSLNEDIATVKIIDGKVVVTPLQNAYGTVTVEVNATANGQSVIQDFNITIDPVNDTPTFSTNLNDILINEDSGIANYEINTTDTEGDDLNITVSSSDISKLIVSQNWNKNEWLNLASYSEPLDFNLTTVQDANGEVDITITVTDSQGAISNDTFTITINPVNDAPILSPISNQYIYKDIQSKSILLDITDIDNNINDLNFNAAFTNSELIKNISFNENNMTIAIEDTLSGKSNINVSVSDGEYNVSKEFSFTVLALKENDSIKDEGTVEVDENETVTVTFEDNKTVKAQTKPDNNGTVSHEIDLDGTLIKASSDLNGTIVEITDNGVKTKYENTTLNIKAEVNATIAGLASHLLDINGTKVEARSEFIGAITTIKDVNGSVEIETSVEVDTNTTVKVVAKQDGTATHTVKKGNLESKASSKVTGAKTLIDENGNVDTSVDTKKNIEIGKRYEAVAITNSEGKTVTKFRLLDTTTNQEENPEPTLDNNESFPVGSEVEIKEDSNNTIHIETTTPTLTVPTVFNIK